VCWMRWVQTSHCCSTAVGQASRHRFDIGQEPSKCRGLTRKRPRSLGP
jgi:hypothetical protein